MIQCLFSVYQTEPGLYSSKTNIEITKKKKKLLKVNSNICVHVVPHYH